MDIKNSAFSALKFVCKNCDINCRKKNDWDRHVLTRKHLSRVNGNQMDINITLKNFACKCGKKYANNSGLWKHSRKCHISEPSTFDEETITPHMLDSSSSEIKALTNLVLEMVKSNTELQKQQNELQKQNNDLHKQVLDVCKHNNTTNNINSHNKTFNLQFFLNEQCKDAMNISDFADSFDLQLSDLESVGELGYVEGITKLFVDKLNSMDIYKRPIHCSDAKREILYVKDDNKWEREERNNPKLRYAIKTISFRNMKLAFLWSETYPESKNGESHLNDTYMRLIKESTGGNGEISISEDKIIRRIAKTILIEK
jgi:predicted transcriptional regulator